ncbi:type I restriction enzyme endonuclease domain-containing protein [Escherichia coli]
MTSLKTSIKTITYLSDTGCLEIQGPVYWSKRDDIKAKLKVELILLLHKHKFPPVANDDVYMGVLAQAENFKKNNMS